MTPRTILHVDMDAFYASVEQHDDPGLRGKPVIVGGTSGRGVVAAASYEVRRFGVRSAMPMSRALALCPQAVCIAPRMARYKEVSRELFTVFHAMTPLVEGLSLDEAFLDVTGSQRLLGDGAVIARSIKATILARTGLTASVGVAPNKLVAKIASDLRKPDGLSVVGEHEVQGILDPLPVRRLPGLGRKKGAEVVAAGIMTLGELRQASPAVLRALFGRDAERMRERAAGVDVRPVVSEWDEKSISAEETFATDVADTATLRSELAALADRASARVRARQLAAGCVQIKIRRSDFSTFTRQSTMVPPGNESGTIASIAQRLLDAWLREHRGARVRLLGVALSDLCSAAQLDLFSSATGLDAAPLDAALDAIRSRFGGHAVARASQLRKGFAPR
jgi:DNA polymerase-4